MRHHTDAHRALAAGQRLGQRIGDVEEPPRRIVAEMLRRDPDVVDQQVEVARPLAAPIARLQQQRPRPDRHRAFEPAARSRIAAGAPAIGDGIGGGAGQAMIALGLHLAEVHDVDRARCHVAQARLFGGVGRLLARPFGRVEAPEIDRATPAILTIEGHEVAIPRPQHALRRIMRGGGIAGDEAGEQVAADQGRIGLLPRRFRRAEIGGEHQRSAQHRDGARVARCRLQPHRERQRDRDPVARAPRPRHRRIAARQHRRHRSAVDRDLRRPACPARYAQRDRETATAQPGEGQRRLRLERIARIERHLRAARRPIGIGGGVEIDVEGPIHAFPEDRIAMFGTALHPRPHAAPESVVGGGREVARRAAHQRRHIGEAAGRRVLLRHDVVELRALVIVEQRAVRLPRPQLPGQLEHIVGVAMLAGLFGNVLGDRIGRGEIFAVGIAADDIAVMPDHRLPEGTRGAGRGGIAAAHLVQPGEADQLGHLRIGVEIGEPILAARERIEHLVVVEQPRHPQPLRRAGPRIELGIAFVETAIFATEHRLHLRRRQCGEDARDISRQPLRHRQSLRIAPRPMHVEQPGEPFVDGIERRPRAVEVEPARRDLAPRDLGEDRLAIDDRALLGLAPERTDIAGAAHRLRRGDLVDDIVRAPAQFRIAALLPGEHQSAEIMAERMAGDRVALPSAVDRGLRRQSGVEADVVQQPVGLEPQQIAPVDRHRGRLVRRP